MIRAWALLAGLALLATWDGWAAPAPVVFESAPGHFEVAALEAAAAESVATRAEEGWQLLATPLGLPERFSTPVFVRLVPAADWGERAPFRVIIEAGGVVSVRVRWDAQTADLFLRRALVQALLMRLAVSYYGVAEKLAAPLWVELGCVGWWETRADPAQGDALRQRSRRFNPPGLADLLSWQRGAAEMGDLTVGAAWLLAWLQAESGHEGEWPAMLRRLLGGEPGAASLAACFPGRFVSEAERELWWQTGWHSLSRARALPTLEAWDSRGELASLVRFVFAREDRDNVVPLATVLTHANEPAVEAELQQRASELSHLIPALHPFYRNAGLSLTDALAAGSAKAAVQATRVAAFERDWRDAVALELATQSALDALEKK